jgi:hypothetical protein
MPTRQGLILTLFLLSACRPNVVARGGLDRLERAVAPTAAQRPAWDNFRQEAEASDANWNGSVRRILNAQSFDAAAASAAADSARADAQRLIKAWEKVDAFLTPAQRAALRRVEPL